MSRQTWVETFRASKSQGASLSNSTTPTSLLPTADKITLPNNLLEPGKVIRVTATGRISNIVTTPGTLTLDIRLGAVVAFNGGAMQLSTTAHTTVPFWWDILVTCRAEGSSTSANLIGLSKMESQAVAVSGADGTSGHGQLMAPNTTPAVGTGFDSTASQTVDLFGTFSIANAGNLVGLEQFVLESLN